MLGSTADTCTAVLGRNTCIFGFSWRRLFATSGVYVWSDSGYTLTRQFRRSSDIFSLFFYVKMDPFQLEKPERCDCRKNAPALRRHSQKLLLRQQRRRGVTASSCCREHKKPSSSPAALAPSTVLIILSFSALSRRKLSRIFSVAVARRASAACLTDTKRMSPTTDDLFAFYCYF